MSELRERARNLGLRAVVEDWEKYAKEKWLEPLIEAEEKAKDRNSLDRRVKDSQIGNFKPMSEFDWEWPEKIDRAAVEDLFDLDFLKETVKGNVVIVGTNGLGKSMIAQNLAHEALIQGYTTRFVKASQMLGHLAQKTQGTAYTNCLKKYCSPDLLVIDEVGYMNYGDRYADLLYEVINGRYQNRSTLVTTNKGFKQWSEIFPNAGCVVTLVDRLLHKSEPILIEGVSYRAKEAEERAAKKDKERKSKRNKRKAVER